jgi:hypothetical protein
MVGEEKLYARHIAYTKDSFSRSEDPLRLRLAPPQRLPPPHGADAARHHVARNFSGGGA